MSSKDFEDTVSGPFGGRPDQVSVGFDGKNDPEDGGPYAYLGVAGDTVENYCQSVRIHDPDVLDAIADEIRRVALRLRGAHHAHEVTG